MSSIRTIRKRGQRRTADRIAGRWMGNFTQRLPSLMAEYACKRIESALAQVISKTVADIVRIREVFDAAALESLKEVTHEIQHPRGG